ncbi:ComF family protein [Thermoleptolyngbya oregonensis NK1-22]|uniref:ComF family protein n=2 Tax=Thermoleptolyngbya TaxID=2303528 RepID=A0AA96YBV6_9CYAN|nr:ComF family protein [Thermoleptolyngbya oregonensis NK1-22]
MNLLQPLLNLVLQPCCPMCGRTDGRSPAPPLCIDCDRRLTHCQMPQPTTEWRPPLPVFSWGKYQGTLKQAIATLKYNHHPELARPLGHAMGRAWLHSVHGKTPLIVVPIPMHADKQKQRGFNQAELLATSFCQVTRLPLERRGLVRVRATTPQFGLSVEERSQNVAGAFQVGPAFGRSPRRPVLLLDDIYTTGATARNAAACLEARGIRVYGLVALASPRFGDD